jgi:hypothetical protein
MDEAPTTEQTQPADERPLSLLAGELFGQNFHGKPPPENAPSEPVEPSTEASVEVPVEEEPVEAPQEESLADIIRQNLESDPALLESLKLKVKVNGQESEATLQDLVKNYQIDSAIEQRLEEAKARAKAITEEAAQKSVRIDEQLAISAKVIAAAEAQLTKDIERANLAELRNTDPAEYAATLADIKDRRAEIESMKTEAITAYRQYQANVENETQTQRAQLLEQEREALYAAIPEWRDEEKSKGEKTQLAEYLTQKMRFTTDDIAGAIDHRLMVMARKAMRYDEMMANTDASLKKVAAVPKVLKPGAQKTAEQHTREAESHLKQRLKRSGSIEDAYQLLRTRRGN